MVRPSRSPFFRVMRFGLHFVMNWIGRLSSLVSGALKSLPMFVQPGFEPLTVCSASPNMAPGLILPYFCRIGDRSSDRSVNSPRMLRFVRAVPCMSPVLLSCEEQTHVDFHHASSLSLHRNCVKHHADKPRARYSRPFADFMKPNFLGQVRSLVRRSNPDECREHMP